MPRSIDLVSLPDDWDGPGSKRIHPRALAAYANLAATFTGQVPEELEPLAARDGGIRLEWDRGADAFIAEITAGGGLYLCHLTATEQGDTGVQYPFFDAGILRRFYDNGRIEVPL